MLEQLRATVVDKPRHFLGLCIGLNTDEVTMQIAKIRASLPEEVKQAASIQRQSERLLETASEDAQSKVQEATREAERIVADARQQAQMIVEQAKLEQQRLVNDNEILKLAKSQSEEVRRAAESESQQLRRGAEDYAFDVLTQLENLVGKALHTIERGKTEIKPPEQALVNARGAQAIREKTRV